MKLESRQQTLITLAAKGKANVLITGPTGSGKTFLARKIHEASARKSRPFVTVNLATLHEGTFESELFGHERGAFTGADLRRVGRLEMAQGGTVFLDEVGDLTPRLQARLLEFLQSRVISPVGSNREIRLDVRVIAATNKDLTAAVLKGDFREDLFHRLRVVAIGLKSLNERWDEFDELVHSTLSEVCASNEKSILRITEEVAERLERHDWPGNLRELRNVLEYAVLAAETGEIRLCDLPDWFASDSIGAITGHLACAEEKSLLADFSRRFVGMDHASATGVFEKHYLETALQRSHWRINRTAKRIGINKTTLIRRMRHYGLKADQYPEVDAKR